VELEGQKSNIFVVDLSVFMKKVADLLLFKDK